MIQNRRSRHQRKSGSGFTLIELLVVIAIIGILSAFSLTVLNGAREDAKASRAKTQIVQLDNLIMQRWEDYQFRRLPINLEALRSGPTTTKAHVVRLYAQRELMRLEMPDRLSDLVHDPVGNPNNRPAFLRRDPALLRFYRKKVFESQRVFAQQELGENITSFSRALEIWRGRDPENGYRFQGAECLYLIISSIENESGRAIDRFRNDIGDADSDGMFEIQDPWGNPIEFIRWPAGLHSPVQTKASKFIASDTFNADPFDPFQADPRWSIDAAPFKPYALTPLVYSAGRDQLYGIATEIIPGPYCYGTEYMPNAPGTPFLYAKKSQVTQNSSIKLRNDPYIANFSTQTLMGFILEPAQQFDNIDNHFGVVN